MVTTGLALPARSPFREPAPPDRWRTFEIVTRVEVLDPSGPTRIWVPTPLGVDTPYQRAGATTFAAGGGAGRLVAGDGLDAVGMVAAEFPAGTEPVLTVTSRAETRDHAVAPTPGAARTEDTRKHFLRPTR